MKKIYRLLLLATFFTNSVFAWRWEAPDIHNGAMAEIHWKEQLDAFFDKIKRGQQDNASRDDKQYYEYSKKINSLFITSRRATYRAPNEAERLPPEIWELTSLRHLSLDHNIISTLPPEIGNLTNLESLSLDDNQLTSIPPEIGKLRKLHSLRLANNKLTAIPEEIGNFQDLFELTANNNKLTSIPSQIGKLKTLGHLKLHHNQLTSIPKEIGNLTKLAILSLHHNQLTSLPPEIGRLKRLIRLSSNNNKLTSLPPEIGRLKRLFKLKLHHNQLTSLPPEIEGAESLFYIDLSNNQLKTLPSQMKFLNNRMNLNVRENPIRYIPKGLWNWQNEFRYIPKELWSWKNDNNLDRKIFLDAPPIPQPDSLGIVELSHPQDRMWVQSECKNNPWYKRKIQGFRYTELLNETVRPQSCSVDCWPTDAGSSIENKVTIVFESREQLENFALESELFKWTGELERIQVLNLQNLQLTEIPEFVFKCKNLERLFLEDNYIEDVPEIISELKELTFLSLGNNRMHKLPRSLRKFTKLRGLLLDANPLDAMDPIPNLRHLKYLEFISMNSEVANRLGMEAISNEDQKIIDSEIPDMSVMVKPSVSRHSNYCVIS